jgi:lipopolysaccharide transport system permease protein
MLSVYTYVFSVIFRNSWPTHPGDRPAYAIELFAGIVAYSVFSESVNHAPLLIVQNPNYVKKVVFPLELLPASLVGSALVHSMLSLPILFVASLWFGPPHWTWLLLPLVYLPLIALTAGVCWFLAALGVFLRDVGNLVAVIVQLLFFVTPIVYPMQNVPASVKPMAWLNPLAAIVENFRHVTVDGRPPDWIPLILVTLVAAAVAVGGYTWFMKLKRAFADVI